MALRKIQRGIKNKFIKKSLRKLKQAYFACVGFCGTFIFWLMRCSRLLPVTQKFSGERVKNILVIRTDRVGDVLLSTPAVRALREQFPQSRISFLATPYTKELLLGNPDISEMLVYDHHLSLTGKLRFIGELKRRNFDLAVVLFPAFLPALIAFLSGAPFRAGYPVDGSGFLLTEKVGLDNRYKHEIESSLEVVRVIGVDTANKKPALIVTPEAEAYAEAFFTKNDIVVSDAVVGVHPGAFEEYQRWEASGFAQAADFLISELKAKVIILGGSLDRETKNAVIKSMKQAPIVSDDNLNLQQLAALIKRCRVFLGNNSGPMHIASALEVPVVAVFGSIHPMDSQSKWAPYGENNIIVKKAVDCQGCDPACCRDYKCIKSVTAQEVIAALRRQLDRHHE
jgi:lipopolysaccharide heptosyltransferase II